MSDQMLKYLETFLPFLNGIQDSLMDAVEKVFTDGEIEDSDEVFLVYISNDLINLSSQLNKNSKNKVKTSKYIQGNVLPLPYEKELKKELKNIQSQFNQLKRKSRNIFDYSHLETRMREAFIDVFVKMFYDYEKYICILDEDVVFNKLLFMNTISSKEDKKFYEEFIDSQLFQQFTQNILKNECSYFNRKIKEKKEKEKKKKDKKSENRKASVTKKDSVYLIRPDYLGIKENDKNLIEQTIKEKYQNDEMEIKEIKKKILDNLHPIESEKYVDSNCIIYLTPENKDSAKEEENKRKLQEIKEKSKQQPLAEGLKFKASSTVITGDLTDKQKEQIKEDIKDVVIKIFKSEIDKDNKMLKADAIRNLEHPFSRTFFISLISNNLNNVISLQDNSFSFLETLINNIINSSVKLEETEQIIEEMVILIKSIKFFETQKKEKSSKKIKTITMYESMKKGLQSYTKLNQKNFWLKWFELDLKKKLEEEADDDNEKTKLIVNICNEMIMLEISKSIIKNVADTLNNNIFGEGSEKYEKTKDIYHDLITKAQYISIIKK